ncbi:BgTH12-05581, partial [Blumeria graminis f. sp. triticale]
TNCCRLVEIRAVQRTFEGAYVRTALGQFSFALVILKMFTREFYSIGALFALHGFGIFTLSIYRRHQAQRQFFKDPRGQGSDSHRMFRTSGNFIMVLTAISLATYVALLCLTLHLGK